MKLEMEMEMILEKALRSKRVIWTNSTFCIFFFFFSFLFLFSFEFDFPFLPLSPNTGKDLSVFAFRSFARILLERSAGINTAKDQPFTMTSSPELDRINDLRSWEGMTILVI
jgi:hypothetical protein